MRASLVLLMLCGCHSSAPRAVRKLVGEVHVHGFEGGSHPCATFVAAPVAADAIDGDTIVAPLAPLSRGSCMATTSSDPVSSAQLKEVDAGPLRILGGRGIERVELAFESGVGYRPVGAFPRSPLFTGGEPLRFEADGAAAPAFKGTLAAPARLDVTEPAPLTGVKNGLTVRWKPDRGERIVLTLTGSTSDGRWTVVRCRADDAAGAFTFPDAMLARLPPPPRDLQLGVSRDAIARVPTTVEGTGVILHASFARKLDAHEER
jgi:hypothetical protein